MKIYLIILTYVLSLTVFAQDSAKPWMGIAIEKAPKGVLIKEALPDTPALKAGLKPQDVVQKIDEIKVTTPQELIDAVAKKGIGATVKVYFLREDKEQTVTLTLILKPGVLELVQKQYLNKKAINIRGDIISGSKKKRFSLDKFKQPSLIMFWATWCFACNLSQPELAAFATKYKGKLNVIAVSYEESLKIKKYAYKKLQSKETNENVWFIAADKPKSAGEAYSVPALPTFMVVDKEDKIRFISIGGGRNMREAMENILTLIE